MTPLLLIAGGSLGTLARYYGTKAIGEWTGSFAAGTFSVNVLGAFTIGLFLTLSQERFDWPSEWRLLVAAGFLGAFTTFSTLAWETWRFADVRDFGQATLNLGGTIVLGMIAVWAGAQLARAVS